MQGDEQPPGGPPGDPLDDPFGNPLGDPRNNPIDPFANDPFDAMFDSLTGNTYPSDSRLTRDIQYPSIGEEVNLDETLGQFERGIENTPPIRPGPDDIGKTLDRLEDDIEGSESQSKFGSLPVSFWSSLGGDIEDLLPEADQIEISDDEFSPSQQNPIASGKGTDNKPPLPYYLENLQQSTRSNKSPHRKGRIGRLGGKSSNSSQTAQDDEFYCPIQDTYVSEDFCEDQNCQYYDEDWDQQEGGWPCTYYE